MQKTVKLFGEDIVVTPAEEAYLDDSKNKKKLNSWASENTDKARAVALEKTLALLLSAEPQYEAMTKEFLKSAFEEDYSRRVAERAQTVPAVRPFVAGKNDSRKGELKVAGLDPAMVKKAIDRSGLNTDNEANEAERAQAMANLAAAADQDKMDVDKGDYDPLFDGPYDDLFAEQEDVKQEDDSNDSDSLFVKQDPKE